MAKLVDALASGASVRKDLGVRISLEAHSNFFWVCGIVFYSLHNLLLVHDCGQYK